MKTNNSTIVFMRQNHDMIMKHCSEGLHIIINKLRLFNVHLYSRTQVLVHFASIKILLPLLAIEPTPSSLAPQSLTCWATTTGKLRWNSLTFSPRISIVTVSWANVLCWKAYLHIRKRANYKPVTKYTVFKLDKRNLLITPSPIIVMRVGFQPHSVPSRKGLHKNEQHMLNAYITLKEKIKSRRVQPLASPSVTASTSMYRAVTLPTHDAHRREKIDWTPAACPWSGDKSFFFRRNHCCFCRRGHRGARTATGECTWRLCKAPLAPMTRSMNVVSNNTSCRAEGNLGEETPHGKKGLSGQNRASVILFLSPHWSNFL